jgi:hypothetical protein
LKIGSLQLIHNFGKKTISKTVDAGGDNSLMLAQSGSYLWTGAKPASRYEGWFFGFGDNRLLKIIDEIRVAGAGDVVVLENNFWNVKKIRQNLTETFWMPAGNCLAYEIDRRAEVEFFLDIKEPYLNPEFGRHYKVEKEDGLVLVRYCQDGGDAPEIFLAICGDISEVKITQEWVLQDYDFDRSRGSVPWDRWVFIPAAINASKIVFVAGFNKENTAAAAKKLWRDFEKNKQEKQGEWEKQNHDKLTGSALLSMVGKSIVNDKIAAAICAQNALKMLRVGHGRPAGLRAGLPWFFQIWQRDDAVSLNGLGQFDQKTSLDIFWRQIAELKINNFDFDTADGTGWLFLRAADFFRHGKFSARETEKVFNYLKKSIGRLLEEKTKNNLAISGGFTWMDSVKRADAVIEVQALRLNMYSLAAAMAAGKKNRDFYLGLENETVKTARQMFFDGRNLADGFDTATVRVDPVVRPNIFLAAYIYPKLLSKSEWIVCFESALDKLWLDWGGLGTIDKNDPRFCGRDTGEDPAAYHNGDSWFWVNNLAAIAMARVDKKRFKNYIDKIFEASKNDILWNGAIGCASEISSAEIYVTAGCANQAWSNATFLELAKARE